MAGYAHAACVQWINMLKVDTNVLETFSDVSQSQEVSDVLTGHGYKMFPIPILDIFLFLVVKCQFTHSGPSNLAYVRVAGFGHKKLSESIVDSLLTVYIL